ncbi:phospholipid carrier-dependent glycosyltransferase [Candidatus Parcubacteria bacterium]|nr:phospholipid carrier-dependent glycosyltransferase [Candidatus Parcubacteria bacterium]
MTNNHQSNKTKPTVVILSVAKNPIVYILILAILLRFYNISNLPSLNPDEAAIGYNAYSLLQTGKDEHSIPWPIHFKSFSDFKPGGYFYLTLPFIKILGLTPLAVRLPNLILSILSIYFLYKLVLLITNNLTLSLLSAFLLSINPWHIHFSRGAWESCTALSFIIIGTYYFYKNTNTKQASAQSPAGGKHNLYLFALFLSLSLYTYHSARIFAPLLALSLFFINRNKILRHPELAEGSHKKFILSLFFGILITLPVVFSFFKNGGTTRFSGVGITADQGPLWRSNELLNHHFNQSQKTTLINRITHNARVLYAISWAEKYFSHFDLNFLFINGDEVPRSKSPEIGQFHLIELPFLILGIVVMLSSRAKLLSSRAKLLSSRAKSRDLITTQTNYKFIFLWLFLSPIASSLTFQAPSALRALPMVIPLTILTAFGIQSFLSLTHKQPSILFFLVIFYSYSIAYYLSSYHIHSPKRYPFAWNQGFDRLIPYIESQKNNFSNIYITDKYDQPYILYLFYSKYPPPALHNQIKLTPPDKFGFSTVKQIDNIHFEKINWDNIPSNSLIVASNETVPIQPVDIINFTNDLPAFKIYTKQ